MANRRAPVAVSAPGKVLLAGGYLVLDRRYTGLVLGLSARINVVAAEVQTSEGVELNEIVVESPQFVEAQWRYGYHLAPEGGGIQVTQLQVGSNAISPNPFVETTLSYALTYINRAQPQHGHGLGLGAARLVILADNDYYSQTPEVTVSATAIKPRFATFSVPLKSAHKTGLGSSAALVTALTAALLSHYLPRDVVDIATPAGQRTLHNLAQAAHCAAQGKIGSGFDVAAAVYGSCVYRRFSPDLLSGLPEAGAPGFSDKLAVVVDGTWDVEITAQGLRLPPGMAVRMCDVDCGSESVGMARRVLAWRDAAEDATTRLWDQLQARNEQLAAILRGDGSRSSEIPAAIGEVRALVREMGALSGVPIEPADQTALLDALTLLDGVYGGLVPGAGGFDALALIVDDDEYTRHRVVSRLDGWERASGKRVRLLDVRGETEGVRMEPVENHTAWGVSP